MHFSKMIDGLLRDHAVLDRNIGIECTRSLSSIGLIVKIGNQTTYSNDAVGVVYSFVF